MIPLYLRKQIMDYKRIEVTFHSHINCADYSGTVYVSTNTKPVIYIQKRTYYYPDDFYHTSPVSTETDYIVGRDVCKTKAEFLKRMETVEEITQE